MSDRMLTRRGAASQGPLRAVDGNDHGGAAAEGKADGGAASEGAAHGAAASTAAAITMERRATVSGDGEIKFGRFSSTPGARLGIAHTAFLYADKEKLSQKDIDLALDVWDLTRPNLIIALCGPWTPHPSHFVLPEMLVQHELAAIVEEAKDSMALAMGVGATNGAPAKGIVNDAALHVTLGAALQQKILTAIVALLNACEQTNSWILMDFSPNGLWYLLEEALAQTTARPVIITVEDCGEDASPYYYKDQVQKQAWQLLKENAQPLAPGADVQTVPLVALPDTLWGEGDLLRDDVINFRDENYARFPCRCSTHAILTRSPEPFNMSLLAPKGTIYLAGGPATAGMMMQGLAKFEPSVFLMHTGGATDFYSHAINIILNEGVTKANDVLQRMQERYNFWNKDVTDHKGMTSSIYGGVPSERAYLVVKRILDLYMGSPESFKCIAVVLNMWKVTPHETLERLSGCFATSSSISALHDIGAQDAKDQSILLAWEMHDTLEYNCRHFEKLTNTLTVMGTLLSLATTALSVFVTFTEDREETSWSNTLRSQMAWKFHNEALLILPALAGLMMTALSRLQYLNKWGAMHLAKLQIESEIWQFRADAGEYGQHKAPESMKKKDKDKKKEEKSANKPQDSRTRFTQRTTTIFSHVLRGEMAQDAFGVPASKGSKSVAEEHLKKKRVVESSPTIIDLQDATAKREDWQPVPLLAREDDLVGSVTGEAYFELRVGPQLARMEKTGPKLSRRLLFFEIFLLVTSLTSTLLAALQYKELIPLAVAFSSTLSSFMQYQALHGRLSAVNAAITDITMLKGTWASLGVVEKRTESVKNLMVNITEGAILREATAFVAGAAQLTSLNTVGKGDEKSDSKKEK